MSSNPMIKGFVVPGLPHPLLAPEKNAGWQKIRNAFDRARTDIENTDADLMIIYSTYWPSIIGTQVQAFPEPVWTHVDELFHDLGEIPYKFKMDSQFAEKYCEIGNSKGLKMRATSYYGFPIDTGSVVALKLLNPDNRIPAVIVSSNIYADRAETIVTGKAGREAVAASGRKAVAVTVNSLSNRIFDHEIVPSEDRIHSLKDDEWNRKFLEFFEEGRLEDISQLSRQFHREARVHKVNNFKPFWWLAAMMGENNYYSGEIYDYQPIWGSGAAVIGLTPAERAARDLEYDEDSPNNYGGERNVLGPSSEAVAEFSSQTQETSGVSLSSESSDDLH